VHIRYHIGTVFHQHYMIQNDFTVQNQLKSGNFN